MSHSEKGSLEKLLDQISGPWDWVAAGVGAATGAGLTVASGGVDLGSSVGAGALTGVTAKKAISASLQGRSLRKRAKGFKSEILRRLKEHPELDRLRRELDREQGLWRSGVTTKEQFATQLRALVEKYRVSLNSHRGDDG